MRHYQPKNTQQLADILSSRTRQVKNRLTFYKDAGADLADDIVDLFNQCLIKRDLVKNNMTAIKHLNDLIEVRVFVNKPLRIRAIVIFDPNLEKETIDAAHSPLTFLLNEMDYSYELSEPLCRELQNNGKLVKTQSITFDIDLSKHTERYKNPYFELNGNMCLNAFPQ